MPSTRQVHGIRCSFPWSWGGRAFREIGVTEDASYMVVLAVDSRVHKPRWYRLQEAWSRLRVRGSGKLERVISNRLPLFITSRPAAVMLATAFAALVLSEYRIGLQKPRAGSSNRDNGSGRAVGQGLMLSYGGGLLLSIVSSGTVCTRRPRTVFLSGLAMAVAGQTLRLISVKELGQSFTFTIHIHPEQRVVTTGPYRLIRHPSYAGALICALGFCLAYGNWLSPVAVTFLAAGYVRRIPSEEAAMLDGLGEPYAEYMSRSKRLIPFIF